MKIFTLLKNTGLLAGLFMIASTQSAIAQDDCATATVITPGAYTGTTVGMGADIAPACIVADGTGGGVWYSITGNNGCMAFTADLCTGTTYDSRIRVYEGTCGALTCVDGNEDFCGTQSSVSWDYTPGVNYFILVHGNGAAEGAFTLTVTEGAASADNTPPALTPGPGTVDVNVTTNNTCMATFGQADLAQSFIPNQNSICGAGIELTGTGSGTGDVTIELWDALPNGGGTMLATGTANGTAAPNVWVDVTWPSVSITPGNTYYLVVTGTNTSLCWAGDTGNGYPDGNTFANSGYSAFSGFDYVFRTVYGCGGTTLPDLTDPCQISTTTPPTAIDACAGTITGVPDVSFPIYQSTVITWTYDDGAGNIATQTQNVVISDATAPVPDLGSLADINENCSSTPTAPTATDNCLGTVTGTPDVTFPITTAGLTVVTWTYTDSVGNTSTQTQNVNINDAVAPVPDNGTLADESGCVSVTPAAPTATDNCAGAVTGTPDVTFPITASGTTVVTWTYDDGNGNVSTQTQNVIVDTVDVGVTQSGATLTADATGGATYQWIDCNTNMPISGETNASFTPTDVVGDYAVIVTENGCTDTSACFNVDYTSIDEALIDVSIYPNPSNGIFNVEYNGVIQGELQMTIIDLQGRIIYAESFIPNEGNHIQEVDIADAEAGVYIIKVSGDNGVLFENRITKE